MNKSILMLLSAACLSSMWMTPVFAASTSTNTSGIVTYSQDATKTASITIQPNTSQAYNESLIGKTFRLYPLLSATNAKLGESINYDVNPNYRPALHKVVSERLGLASVTDYQIIDYMQTLNTHHGSDALTIQSQEHPSSAYRQFIEDVRQYIDPNTSDALTINITHTQNDGSFKITNLPYGFYLIDEVTDVTHSHQAASLCIATTANPNSVVHIKSDYPMITKKIFEDDLGIGYNDIGDFEIGQTIHYKFESNVPNIAGFNQYYYAWHDIMDEAITFDGASSIQITISNLLKSYTLDTSEWTCKDNGLTDACRFEVMIDDLKKIVEREFGPDQFGQLVTLTFTGRLNDKAALRTGRSGAFENTVFLEFANDFDGIDDTTNHNHGTTGYSPKDTVVAYTYRLDILKTNDQTMQLENAHFRLYDDASCSHEIKVKHVGDHYIVMNDDGPLAGPEEMVTPSNGEIHILGLDQGTYYLKETHAPEGYRLLKDPIEISITPTFTTERQNYSQGTGQSDQVLKNLTAKAKVHEFLAGLFHDSTLNLTTDLTLGAIALNVINTTLYKLPETGSSTLLMLAGSGIAFLLIGMVMRRRFED